MDNRFIALLVLMVVAGMVVATILGVQMGTILGRGQVSCPQVNFACPEYKCPAAPEAEIVLLNSDGTFRTTEAEEILNSWLEDGVSFTVSVQNDSLTIVKETEDHLEIVMLFAR